MNLVVDIDGVLARFVPAYIRTIVESSGRDLFLPDDVTHWPRWDTEVLRGYTPEEIRKVWWRIETTPDFWFGLEPITENTEPLAAVIHVLARRHNVYFVTQRSGLFVKRQTELWLEKYLNHTGNTVLIVRSHSKGQICHALNIDVFVDDKYSNCTDVVSESPSTRVYLIDTTWNRGPEISRIKKIEDRRIRNLSDMLHDEGLVYTGMSSM